MTLKKTLFVASFAAAAGFVACTGSDDSDENTPDEGAGGAEALGGMSGEEEGGAGAGMDSEDEPSTPTGHQVFLLFGQSNMEGAAPIQPEDREEHPRVRVLAFDGSCNGRTYNEWAPAVAPLHRCWAGVGPGDSFGRAMAEAWPDATIDLVPAAISGVDIDFFVKGVVSDRRDEFQIPPDNMRDDAYEMLLERAQIAQEVGPIRGILFHQGESDTGDSAWVAKVASVVADLKADLGLGDDVPFLAGEIPYGGCCSVHNSLVRDLPDEIPNAHVISAEGLELMDEAHFNREGALEIGNRYAATFLEVFETE